MYLPVVLFPGAARGTPSRLRAALGAAQRHVRSAAQLFRLAQDALRHAAPPDAPHHHRDLLAAAFELGLQVNYESVANCSHPGTQLPCEPELAYYRCCHLLKNIVTTVMWYVVPSIDNIRYNSRRRSYFEAPYHYRDLAPPPSSWSCRYEWKCCFLLSFIDNSRVQRVRSSLVQVLPSFDKYSYNAVILAAIYWIM